MNSFLAHYAAAWLAQVNSKQGQIETVGVVFHFVYLDNLYKHTLRNRRSDSKLELISLRGGRGRHLVNYIRRCTVHKQ